jgi:uncharacterized membrane protein
VDSTDWWSRLREQPRWLYALLAVGAGLRLYGLGVESYWLDEVASIDLIASRSLAEVLVEVPLTDRHPPLYYAILKLWTTLTGISEAVTRLPAAVFGIAALPLLYVVATRLYDRQVGLLATALFALSTFQLGHAQDTRMYSLLAFTTLLSFYWLLRLLDDWGRWNLAGYVLATVLMGYTHAFGLFVVFAQTVYVGWAWWHDGAGAPQVDLRRWLGAQVAVGVALLPWVGVLSWQAFLTPGGAEGLGWIDAPTLSTLVRTPGRYLSSLYPLLGVAVLVLVGLCYFADRLLGDGPLVPRRTVSDGGIAPGPLLVAWVAVPVAVALALSYLVTPIYVHRYTIGVAVGFYVALGGVVRAIDQPSLQTLAVVLLLMGVAVGLPGYYGADQNEQWREVATYLDENGDGDDLVLLTDLSVRHPFEYYFSGSNETHTRVAVPDTLNESEIRDRVRGYDTVWFVASNSNARNIAKFSRAFQPPYTLVESRNYRGISVIEFRNASTAERATATNASAAANDSANATTATPTPSPTPPATASPGG